MRITSSVHCGRRAGRRRLRTRRHAPAHAPACLLTVAMKWTSRWHPHPLLPVVNTPLRPCSSLLAQRRRPCCACEIRLTRSLSKLPEHTSSSAKTLPTDCAPSRKLWTLVALNRSILLQSRPKRRRGHLTAASSSPSFSTIALCFVEVVVSHWCLYAIRFVLYSLVAAGAGTAEVAVCRARGRGGYARRERVLRGSRGAPSNEERDQQVARVGRSAVGPVVPLIRPAGAWRRSW